MNCATCGTPLPEGSTFCNSCGTRQGAMASPQVGQPVATAGGGLPKSRVAAGILGILLGGLGIHRFYLGYTTIGIIQIVVTLVTCGAGSVWGLVEGILILAKSTITTDASGRPLTE